jgi:hypothetical protein
MEQSAYDLDERLLEFSVRIIKLVEELPDTKAGNHVARQILRSGTSPHPNHGEAQSAEPIKDFVHKFHSSIFRFDVQSSMFRVRCSEFNVHSLITNNEVASCPK